MESILWNEAAEPCDTSLADVVYNIRREDPENLLMDSVTSEDILAEADAVLMFDALVVPYQQLLRRMTIMRRLMNRAGTKLKVEEDTDEMKGMVISEPFKKNGTAQVAVTFNLEDGQTISIFFHNPDATPAKIGPSDDLISWKWLLNKKDVTIVVAPEHGKDLDVHEVSRRIMKLADKNSAAFARANAKKAERLQKIEEQESEISTLEAELAKAKAEFEEMQADADKQAKRLAEVNEKYAAAEKRVADLTKERDELKAKKEAEAAAKKAAEEKAAAELAAKDKEVVPPSAPAPEPGPEEKAPPKKVERPEDKFVFVNVGADGKSTVQTLGDVMKKADDGWKAIEEELNQIIAGSHPKMGEISLCDWIIDLIDRYENDAEKYPKIREAMAAIQNLAVNSSSKALSGQAG